MRLQFGGCTIDDDSRQLLRAGVEVHLSPKAFDLLMALIRERPRVMSKEALHGQLWPNTFVSDASLAMLVVEVRAALGESGRQPDFVRTVHRRGYAFQANAVEVPAAPIPDQGEAGFWLVTETSQVARVARSARHLQAPRVHSRRWRPGDAPGFRQQERDAGTWCGRDRQHTAGRWRRTAFWLGAGHVQSLAGRSHAHRGRRPMRMPCR